MSVTCRQASMHRVLPVSALMSKLLLITCYSHHKATCFWQTSCSNIISFLLLILVASALTRLCVCDRSPQIRITSIAVHLYDCQPQDRNVDTAVQWATKLTYYPDCHLFASSMDAAPRCEGLHQVLKQLFVI